MKKAFTLIICVMSFSAFSKGLMSYDSTRYSLAAGFSFSTSNIKRDITNVPHPGLDLKAMMFLTRSIRLSAEYTYNFKHDLDPKWIDVSSNLFEINAQYVASINDYKAGFYMLVGGALQSWRGTYTGVGHEYEFRSYGNPEGYYSAKWPTLALGFGMQRTIKKVELYGEFKYRITKKEENIPASIIDVSYALGARYNIKARNKSIKSKPRIKMPGDRYHWF